MSTEFKIGTKVRLSPASPYWGQNEGTIGKIIRIRNIGIFHCEVEWENGFSFYYKFSDLLLSTPPEKTSGFKSFQQNLIKAS